MGNKVVVKEVIKEVESNESKRAAAIVSLDNQLAHLKQEVKTVEPIIKDNIKSEVNTVEDATLLRYSQLEDMKSIEENIKQVFKGFPAMNVLVDAAANLVAAMNSTDELTEILRWHQRKVVKRVGDKVYGVEVHYKVKILEESKGYAWKSKKETVVMVGYKAIASVMDLDPREYPDKDELEAVML